MYHNFNFIKNKIIHIELNTDGSFKPRWYRKDPFRGTLNIHFFRGAGYRKGFSFYFAFNLKNNYNKRKLFQIGVTSNCMRLPYIDK